VKLEYAEGGFMKRVVLLSCVSKKRSERSTAAEMYTSTFFKYNFQYAHKLTPTAIFILSAKYGLLTLEDEIDPYDMTLKGMPVSERKAWAEKVIQQLSCHVNLKDTHFIILAGERYRENLVSNFSSYETPLKGLRFGEQLQFLKQQVSYE